MMLIAQAYASHWEKLGTDVAACIVFGAVAIGLMVLGFKAFDWITPKLDVEHELAEKHNVAVAIVMGSVILGVSYIIAKIVSA